jgi:hypothetical protein
MGKGKSSTGGLVLLVGHCGGDVVVGWSWSWSGCEDGELSVFDG